MKLDRVSFLAASFLAFASAVGCQSTNSKEVAAPPVWNQYGEKIDSFSPPVSLGTLKGDEIGIAVKGVITEVCTHQGCWIRLKDARDPAAGDLFVKTTDHAYLVPRNAHGRNAIVVGRCELSEMSVADQKHYAEEAGHSEAEIAKITQPKKMITFHADSIMIEGEGLDRPLDQ